MNDAASNLQNLGLSLDVETVLGQEPQHPPIEFMRCGGLGRQETHVLEDD